MYWGFYPILFLLTDWFQKKAVGLQCLYAFLTACLYLCISLPCTLLLLGRRKEVAYVPFLLLGATATFCFMYYQSTGSPASWGFLLVLLAAVNVMVAALGVCTRLSNKGKSHEA